MVLAAVIALPMLFRAPGFGTESPAPSTPAPTQPVAPSPAGPTGVPGPSIGPGSVRLEVGSGSVVNVLIDDPDELLEAVDVEQGDRTMSVRWFDSIVEDGPTPGTIRVLWVGFPRDEKVRLEVSRNASGGILLHFIQAAPPPSSDGEGEDRVIIIDPAEPIDPSDIEVTFDYPA